MALKTRITEMLEIEKPIIQAAMGWIARSQLSSAFSNAGGMGIIETSSGELDAVRAEILKMRDLTDKPFGVNVAQAFVRDPDIVQFVIDQGIKFVTTSAGNPKKYTSQLKEAGLTVALSGLGGDEFFAGYSLFGRIAFQQRALFLWQWFPQLFRAQFARMLFAMNPSIATQKLKRLMVSNGSLAEVYPLGRQCFSEDQVASLLRRQRGYEDPYTALLSESLAQHGDQPLLSRISFAEARTYMHDVLLRDTEQMSMANALEVRVPFLDHELVSYVMGVTDAIKAPGNTPKRLLVESVGDLLPHEVIHRPKQGFTLPFDQWMRGPLKQLCEAHLGVLSDLSVFDGATIDGYWQAFMQGEKTVSWSRLWLLIALGAWCGQHIND